jgi:hypothetical protein
LFLLFSIYSFSLLFTIFYSYVLFVGHFIVGVPKRGTNGGFDSSRTGGSGAGAFRVGPPPLTTDEARNQAFGMSSKEEEDEEDKAQEVSEEEVDGSQQHNYRFLFLVNFYFQLD